MSDINFFSYDPAGDCQPDYFATEAEALASAKEKIANYLTPLGWETDDVEGVIVGRITHRTSEKRFPPTAEDLADPGFDPARSWRCKFELEPCQDHPDLSQI